MKKSKNNPDQLWLNFNQATAEFNTASANLLDAATALCSAGVTPEVKKAVKQTDDEIATMRKTLNAIVCVHARHKNLHWKEVWRLLYERLRDKTGFDAIVKGLAKDIIPLEAVIRAGRLPRLLQLAGSL